MLTDTEAMSTSKRVIRREEWEKKLNDAKIWKEDMNKLVMDFFLIEGYIIVAETFKIESGTELDTDSTVVDRMVIKKAVQSGSIEDGIEKLNDMNPEILHKNPQVFFHLQRQRLIELIRNNKVPEALEFAQKELAPKAEGNQRFLEELERTMTLLVFRNVNKCPLSYLLDRSQRIKTAYEVNSAILASQGHDTDAKLRTLLRTLILAQFELDEKAVYPRINDLATAIFEDPAI